MRTWWVDGENLESERPPISCFGEFQYWKVFPIEKAFDVVDACRPGGWGLAILAALWLSQGEYLPREVKEAHRKNLLRFGKCTESGAIDRSSNSHCWIGWP